MVHKGRDSKSSVNARNGGRGINQRNKSKPSFLDKLGTGEKKLKNIKDAQQFFKQLTKKYENPESLALTFNEGLISVLQHATRILYPDVSEPLLLLQALGEEESLMHGVYHTKMLDVFSSLYRVDEFNRKILERLTTGRSKEHHATIAWYLIQLGKAVTDNILEDPVVDGMIEILKDSKERGFPELAKQLNVIFAKVKVTIDSDTIDSDMDDVLSGKEPSSLEAAKSIIRPPGTRDHDNDMVNYREISIIPTTSELQCTESAYLPNVPIAENENVSLAEHLTLDRLFRLMREDLIGSVKEELKAEFKLPIGGRRQFYTNPRLIGFKNKPEPHIVIQVSIPPRISSRISSMNKKDSENFFESGPGKRILQRGTLALLVHKKDSIVIQGVGTIVERREILKQYTMNAKKSGTGKKVKVLEIGIAFNPETMRSILPLLRDIKYKKNGVALSPGDGGIFNASVGLFSMQPILKVLQKLDRVPLSQQLVSLEPPTVPPTSHGGKTLSELSNELQESVACDAAQKMALEASLKSNVVLVQGPPGTGKTYVGVQTVKAMLELEEKYPSDPPLRILILYTRIKDRCLGEVSGKLDTKFGPQENREYGAIKSESEDLEERFQTALKEVTEKSNWGKSENWWNRIKDFLDDEYYEECSELTTPDISDKDGFQKTGKGGKKIKSNYLWERWRAGQDRGVFMELDKEQRQQMIQEWNEQWIAPQVQILVSTMNRLQENAAALKNLRQRNDLRVLKNAKIIGCTTVAAAKYEGLINPTVVVVEEAGEILEAQVLSCLASCKQLIMIGDHKQLRPKIDNYRLQKESGNGFDANVSLFERLVISSGSNIPVIQLRVQHRMRPQISNLIRGMALYEELEDHENTFNRDHVKGVEKDVIFIDHNNSEKVDEASASIGLETKVNVHEAGMVVNIANYILQQGQYQKDQVTIITPYLGQLALIRRLLNEMNIGSILSDQDQGDLARNKLNDTSSNFVSANHEQSIRVATVDNFQGEESHVIIISLVRSNPVNGRIGFLTSEERVNVLLSRAREGLIVIGNMDSLCNCSSKIGRELWTNVRQVLDKQNSIYNYFPALCQNHKTLTEIRKPEEFSILTPDGGCDKRCLKLLPCGHLCPLRCHNNHDQVHSTLLCKEKVEDVCTNGHKQLRMCHSVDFKCHHNITWTCPFGHTLQGICHRGRLNVSCKTCITLEEKEEQARQIIKRKEEELRKKELDLAEVKCEISCQLNLQNIESKIQLIETERSLADRENLKLKARNDLQGKYSDLPSVKKRKVTNKNDENNDGKQRDNSSSEKCVEVKGDHDSVCSNDSMDESKATTPDTATADSNIINDNITNISEFTLCQEIPSNKLNDDSSFVTAEDRSMVSLSSTKKANEMEESDDDFIPPRKHFKDKEDLDQHLKNIDKKRNKTTKSFSRKSILLSDPNYCDALESFQKGDYLVADDLIENCLSSKYRKATRKTIEAFRFVIHDKLDSSSGTWSNDQVRKTSPTSFEEAIECLATFIYLSRSNTHPLLTKEQANLFLTFHEKNESKEQIQFILEYGKERANSIIKDTEKYLSSILDKSFSETEEQKIISEWNEICKKDPQAPKVVNDEIMKMTGLIEIKRAFIDQYNRIKVAQQQGDSAASSYNIRFEGNPGTGKTTIARHYSTFLIQLGILPEQSISIEVTAASLINKGVPHLEEQLEKIKEKKGGVIFIDEAYQLGGTNKNPNIAGTSILDYILPHAESLVGEYGKLVWIFAGYEKEMEKLFLHNQGLPSRFPQRFVFVDYNESELQCIFRGFMEYKDKPKADESKPAAKRRRTMNMNRTSRSLYSSSGSISYSNGETYNDIYGNKWTYQDYLWQDQYSNSTGYHPKNIGTPENPIASADGQIWERENGQWVSSNGDSQDNYPGSPKTISNGKRVKRVPPFRCDDEKYLRVAIRRIARRSGPGFGNARAIRNFFDIVRENQARRLTRNQSGDLYLFTREDLLGPMKSENELKSTEAYKRLQQMEGLVPVKEQIDLLIKLKVSNNKRELAEKPILDIMLNRVFLGNPGTGKTTVSQIYGNLLKEMGLLSNGEVIVKNPSDFKGDVLGASEKSTRDILRNAEGKVLVIDEAYALCSSSSLNGNSDPYGTAVIDTLVEQVQSKPGDDRAIIMLGYRKEMEEMFKNVNPGLARRFQLSQAYEFPDYNDSALLRILMSKAKSSGLNITIPVAKRAVRSLAKARAKPNFGNAGAIDILLSEAKQRMQKRGDVSYELKIEDFAVDNDSLDEATLESLFDDLVGMDSVRNQLEDLKRIVQFAKSRGENPAESVSFNYLFLGNPGTGKTTVAKRMGTLFKLLGLLPDDEVHECSPKDLITGFVGQAGKKTMELLEKSRGSVLFIDEAYQLNPQRGGSFMTEAVDELCAKLTDEEFKGKLLVILAGYDADMDEMLQVNPGLKSRFAERIHFDDLDSRAVRSLLQMKLEGKKVPLSERDMNSEKLVELSNLLVNSTDFSNGRDVETVVNKVYKEVAKRSGNTRSRVSTSNLKDVEKAVTDLVSSRSAREGGKVCATTSASDPKNQATTSSLTTKSTAPPVVATDIKNHAESDTEEVTDQEPRLKEGDENPFDRMNSGSIASLQEIIEEMGLNTEEGVKRLLDPTRDDSDLITELKLRLGISDDKAKDLLTEWRGAHDKMKKQMSKKKRKGMEAIWHCAVCGRGGKPTPICYVAPYISSYQQITI